MKTGTDLASLSDEAFRKIVDDDLRNKSSADMSQALRDPVNVDRWYSVLLAMSKSVEGQLAARKSDWDGTRSRLDSAIEDAITEDLAKSFKEQKREEREKWLKWRGNIIRFKTGLDEVLAEARHVRDRHLGKVVERAVTEDKKRLERRVEILEAAIRLHHDRTLRAENDTEQEVADEELWTNVVLDSSLPNARTGL